METPIISKKQEKKALSAKKQKKETIKNVIITRYGNYWPALSVEDNNQLKDILEKFLPRVKNGKINVPYKEIKSVPRSERRRFRLTYTAQEDINKNEIDGIVFGVNDVSSLLENRQAASILLSDDIQPRLLVQHIIDQAVLYNVPLLVLNGLRDICQQKCGIRSATIGFKNSISMDSHLGLILQNVSNISENYPVPENHINFNRRFDFTDVVKASSLESENIIELTDSSLLDKDTPEKSYHLLRRENNKRVFNCMQPENKNSDLLEDDCELLRFNVEPAKTQNNNIERSSYKSLIVKRLKGDSNRNKRKMESFKIKS